MTLERDNLRAKLAASEARCEKLRVALKALSKRTYDAEGICYWCRELDHDPHNQDCPIEIARNALARIEGPVDALK